ncbi:glycosyltransferase [Flavobacterium psychrolimnae]|uniref:Glycosyltransferase n=1 Tax=Flavobacterium psychrolimnae TaxID=249351 RepID=A0A366AXA4_9FLAO|nr:glycosyltransferase [Flavobacterium psychrolimnae]RBN49500.1 glycosyltransferase [Flavobacterium psychrolimnae]
MNKIKILFLLSNLESGGVSKSAVTLLNNLDYEKYDVDLLLISNNGILKNDLNKSLNIIIFSELDAIFHLNIKSLSKLLFIAPFRLFLRLFQILISLFDKGYGGILLSKLIPKMNKKYDVAIDYQGQHLLYYLIDSVDAIKKITFFHSDYEKWDYYYSADKKYYPKADHIFTVSPHCVQSLKKRFPSESNKIKLMENIVSIDEIRLKSKLEVKDPLDANVFSILTIGHVCKAKGTDFAIDAMSILKLKNIKFKWYFIGAIDNPEHYSQKVKGNDLINEITFMGLKSNPYPYLNQTDMFVLPSQFEGKSIALDEAKIVCKPIVVTNFSTVNDQFTNRVNASICEMNAKDLADKIEELMINEKLRGKYISALESELSDNRSEIKKLEAIFNSVK